MKKYNKENDPYFGDKFSNIHHQMMEEFVIQNLNLNPEHMSSQDMVDLIYNSDNPNKISEFSIMLASQLTVAIYHPESITLTNSNEHLPN